MVKHVIPKTLVEALDALAKEPYKIIAGGTDAMIQHRSTAETPPKFDTNVMYLFNLPELNYIKTSERGLHIGAMTPLEVLLDHPQTPPLLKTVIREMASPALRYVATLAGNIGNASPAGDSLVPLYVLDATVTLMRAETQRTLPIEAVILGPRKTSIKPDELIYEIFIPHHDFTHTQWHKVGGRRADAISKVSFVGAAKINENIVDDIRFAFGAVYKTVSRERQIESMLIGQSCDTLKNTIDTIIAAFDPYIQPIDDQRSNKIYRKKVAENLLRNFIEGL